MKYYVFYRNVENKKSIKEFNSLNTAVDYYKNCSNSVMLLNENLLYNIVLNDNQLYNLVIKF